MHRVFCVAVICALALPGAGRAQSSDQTLADIRQELSVLYVEIQKLKREMSTTGGVVTGTASGSLLDRVTAIESELQRLTAKTEELEFRIDRVVEDGTNRLGDLEFRLCELESGCDIGQLGEGSTLGGIAPGSGAGGIVTETDQPEVQMAVGEEADFKRAEEALTAGDYAQAAELFGSFRDTYPGGPLSAKAGILRGDALDGAGEPTRAARAYLDVFSTAPDGPEAPEALFKLGRQLGQLGQTEEACVTLGEVQTRYPQAGVVMEANSAMRNIGCP